MPIFSNFFSRYKDLPKNIYYIIIAELLIQCVGASFMILLNYYLLDIGYEDYTIAKFTSYRYILVLLLGFPIGYFLRRVLILPIVRLATIFFCLTAFAIVLLASSKNETLLIGLMTVFGLFHMLTHSTILALLLRLAKGKSVSLVLSLFFQTWGTAILGVGLLTYILQSINPAFFSEKIILLIILTLSSLCIYFMYAVSRDVEEIPQDEDDRKGISLLELKKIFVVVVPTFLIAVGAGFSVPFFNLFYHFMYGIDAKGFSLMTSMSHFLVIAAMTFTPIIKDKIGFKKGIIYIQSLGIICLIVLIWSNKFFPEAMAMGVSIFFYLIRQPLMNTAGPLVSEFALDYIGKKNQPLMASIEASIWSGSFWFSSVIFSYLRKMEFSYTEIFSVTILMYTLAVLSWNLVFRFTKYEKNTTTV